MDDTNTAAVVGIAPTVLINIGESREVKGSGKKPYILKRLADHYSCSCPAWAFQKDVKVDRRSCKHLKGLLGEKYENERCRRAAENAGEEAPPSIPARKRKAATTDKDEEGAEDADAAPPSSSRSKKSKKSENSKDEVQVLLAQSWKLDGKADPKGWWMSEKLDGVRAYWTGSKFLSRNGNTYIAPKWFCNQLPTDCSLDGELWLGRDMFNEGSGAVRGSNSVLWPQMKYMVFDIPSMIAPVEKRFDELHRRFGSVDLEGGKGKVIDTSPSKRKSASASTSGAKGQNQEQEDEHRAGPGATAPPKNVHFLEQRVCEGKENLQQYLEEVQAKGGEGVMLRQPKSEYEYGRSTTLYKVKTFYDAEARVIGYEGGQGKNKGKTGSLVCEMASGQRFKVGTGLSDAQRVDPPKIGTIINYSFQELSKDNMPRFPAFHGVAVDKNEPKDAVVRARPGADD